MDDREVAKRALAFQHMACDYRMMDIAGYAAWAECKLRDGESDAFIAHLEPMSMCITPADLSDVSVEVFEELLAELKTEIG